MNVHIFFLFRKDIITVADSGEGPAPPLFLDQNEAWRAEKISANPKPPPPPTYFRVWITGSPPCLGVWIHYCNTDRLTGPRLFKGWIATSMGWNTLKWISIRVACVQMPPIIRKIGERDDFVWWEGICTQASIRETNVVLFIAKKFIQWSVLSTFRTTLTLSVPRVTNINFLLTTSAD